MHDLIFSDDENNHPSNLNDLRRNKTVEDYRSKTDNSYRETKDGVIPVDIVIERVDNLRQYHEVGPRREVSMPGEESKHLESAEIGDKTIGGVNKESKIDADLVDDELEFAIPLDEDYFMGGSYSVHFCCKLGPIIVASFYGCNLIM